MNQKNRVHTVQRATPRHMPHHTAFTHYAVFVSIALSSTPVISIPADCPTPSTIAYRSIGQNGAHLLSSLYSNTRFFDPEQPVYGSFGVNAAYSRTLRPTSIADALFGNTLYKEVACGSLAPQKRAIQIIGSGVPAIGDVDKNWLADYAYLANNYQSTLILYPLIQNISFDIGTHIGFEHGLFIRAHAPIGTTRWDLGVDEVITYTENGSGFHSLWNGANSAKSFLDYSCCHATPAPTPMPGSSLIRTYGLQASTLCPWPDRKSGIADVHIDMGWNFLNRDDHQIGIYARTVAPTGNRPDGRMLFEAVLGNGKHWELGGGCLGNLLLWEHAHANKQIRFFFDAQVTHLFSTRQFRAFDLKNQGPLSRYMLATNAPLGSSVITITPVANLTYGQIAVTIPFQTDITGMFIYAHDTFTWNVGYNFWATGCEKISNYTPCTSLCAQQTSNNPWYVLGTDATLHTLGTNTTAVPLSAADTAHQNAQTRGLSHTFFTQFAYTWLECTTRIIPHLGIGMQYEAGTGRCATNCAQRCTGCSCTNTMPWQWSVWLTGGGTF